MKLIRNVIITLCLIALSLGMRHLLPVYAQGAGANCSGPQAQCNSLATTQYNQCIVPCSGNTSCINSCKNVRNTSVAQCTLSYNSCIQSDTQYCAVSYCQAVCQQTTGVAASSWDDNNVKCNCTCGCLLSSRPGCSGAVCTGQSWSCNSPILIDVNGEGFHLTNAENGVLFDFQANGTPEQVAWTDPAYGNAWLALDRNHNGKIDSARELFGNLTAQPPAANANGYLALAVYDKPENGGNGDGFIDEKDAIYSSLLLWVDANHNGISEPEELHSLISMHVARIGLNYWEKDKTDEFGNLFRYQARIWDESGSSRNRFTWDVYLSSTNQ